VHVIVPGAVGFDQISLAFLPPKQQQQKQKIFLKLQKAKPKKSTLCHFLYLETIKTGIPKCEPDTHMDLNK
jgi:hypothetical protein